MSCGNRNVSVIAGQGVFQLFYLLKGQLCALCNLPHSKFKDLRLRLRLIGTSFSLSLFLSMFFYSFFQLGRIQHIILNHQDVHILIVCMAFLRKAYSTAAKHRFNQSEYTLPAILSHFIDKRYIFSSNRQTAWTDITCFLLVLISINVTCFLPTTKQTVNIQWKNNINHFKKVP